MNATVKIGAIGLSITLALNVFALLVLGQDAARFFTGEWWTVWFPASIVWVVVTMVGLGRRRAGEREGQSQASVCGPMNSKSRS